MGRLSVAAGLPFCLLLQVASDFLRLGMASLESDAATNLVSATADAAGWGTGGIGSLANSLVDALVRRLREPLSAYGVRACHGGVTVWRASSTFCKE